MVFLKICIVHLSEFIVGLDLVLGGNSLTSA